MRELQGKIPMSLALLMVWGLVQPVVKIHQDIDTQWGRACVTGFIVFVKTLHSVQAEFEDRELLKSPA